MDPGAPVGLPAAVCGGSRRSPLAGAIAAMARVTRRLPMGAVSAVAIMVAFHVIVATWVYPRPAARMDLYRKTAILTDRFRPSVVVAGDSRAESGIVPKLVAPLLGLSDDRVINIAVGAGDTASAAAAARKFAGRFASSPIMVLGVSISKVNDNAPNWKSDELLWSLGFADRVRLVSWRRAVASCVLPEKTLYHRLTGWPRPSKFTTSQGIFPTYASVDERGYHRNPTLPARLLDNTCRSHHRIWYRDADIDGIRWRQLEADVHELLASGVQAVLLHPPLHPAFEACIESDPVSAAVTARYHRKLDALCHRAGIPLLRYGNEILVGADPGVYYDDPLHLNRRGAEILSLHVGRDLAGLVESGVLKRPAP